MSPGGRGRRRRPTFPRWPLGLVVVVTAAVLAGGTGSPRPAGGTGLQSPAGAADQAGSDTGSGAPPIDPLPGSAPAARTDPDPATVLPLPGYTGGGTINGDNRAADAPDRPVMVLSPAATTALEAELADAHRARDREAAALDEARSAQRAARAALDRLDADVARARGELETAATAESQARASLAGAAVAWYIGDAQPVDLSAELFDVGARTARATREVSAEAALERRLGLFGDARRRATDISRNLAGLTGRAPGAATDLDAAHRAVDEAQARLDRADAVAAERRGRLDRLRRRVDPAVADLEGAHTAGVTFPVAGPFEFSDSWGFPRSDGRRHRGSDVFAPTATPLVAMEGGSARADGDPLGGLVVHVTGRSGTRYYYAHLHAIEPAVVSAGAAGLAVAAGDRIGLVGDTGNAAGGAPHLHIQLAPPESDWINPYPRLALLAEAVRAAKARGAAAGPGPDPAHGTGD